MKQRFASLLYLFAINRDNMCSTTVSQYMEMWMIEELNDINMNTQFSWIKQIVKRKNKKKTEVIT